MPPAAYALIGLFLVLSVVVGVFAWWAVARAGGPRRRWFAILPVAVAFGAFYLIGHRWGLVLGPEIGVFGFRVALFGDLLVAGTAAFGTAFAQWGLWWAATRGSAPRPV